MTEFQSQTRRLLPRNIMSAAENDIPRFVSIADATLASPQHDVGLGGSHDLDVFQSQTRRLLPRNIHFLSSFYTGNMCFNRRRDACFPATTACFLLRNIGDLVSIADATLASPQHILLHCRRILYCVSIADATLASPQPIIQFDIRHSSPVSIADATLASPQLLVNISGCLICQVSIADATLASPQQIVDGTSTIGQPRFNRRRDACFPATWSLVHLLNFLVRFNRRRDACFPATCGRLSDVPAPGSFNRRRDACFPATF